MAEGFLQQVYNEKAMESAGDDCFNEFLSRSLIDKEKAEVGEKFRMHDLIYDLAKLVSGKSSCYFESGGQFPGSVSHLTFRTREFDVSRRFEGLYELNCLRTFLPRLLYSSQKCYLKH
uniref:Disease resistance RPP13-like protein 1 n=1 Tax=Cajanus cajan TaxID=3821 RepID=A0A151R5T8_CAJCA|nr:Putative disease resistance RPP13-like protein 1 [Cajanus cajan]